MTRRGEPQIVVVSAAVSIFIVVACVAISPGLWSSPPCALQVPHRVATLTPQAPLLFDKGQSLGGADQFVWFSLDAPAELRGSWVSSSPSVVRVAVLGLFCGGPACLCDVRAIGTLNGTINETLFPGYHILSFVWTGSSTNSTWTVSKAFAATFDQGLDSLAGPGNISIASGSYASWTIQATPQASDFLLQWAGTTNSCHDELAELSARTFQAFSSGEGPLNGNGTQIILENNYTSACGSFPAITVIGALGPYNWTSGEVLVYYNAGESVETITLYAPLDVIYLAGQ